MRFKAIARHSVWLALCGFGLSGCLGTEKDLPAEQAFARSASALSGTDRFRFEGKVAVVGPGGQVAGKSAYTGEVSGHGSVRVKWESDMDGVKTKSEAAAGSQDQAPSLNPMQLLKALDKGTASIEYEGASRSADAVVFRIRLKEASARQRIAEGLKAELATLQKEVDRADLSESQRKQANEVLRRSEDRLASALQKLRVKTDCIWTADRRTWFPSALKEETTLTYTWNDKTYTEKRVSETNFIRNAKGVQ